MSQAALDQKRQGQRGWTAAPPSRAFHFLSPVSHRVQRHNDTNPGADCIKNAQQIPKLLQSRVRWDPSAGKLLQRQHGLPGGQELQKLGVSEVGAQQESTMDHGPFCRLCWETQQFGDWDASLFFGTSLRCINSLDPHWRFQTYHPRIALICIDLPLLGLDVNDMECQPGNKT